MATLITSLVVLLIAGGAVWVMIRDKKNGKGSCGGDCSKCKGCH